MPPSNEVMEQLDVFNFEDLKHPAPSDDELITMATNRLVLNLRPSTRDGDANNAAKLLLQITGKLVDKKQVDFTDSKAKPLTELTDDELVRIASGG